MPPPPLPDARLGEFEIQKTENAVPVKAELLRTAHGVCCVYADGEAETFATGFGHRDGVVLVTDHGTWVRVLMPEGVPPGFTAKIPPTISGFKNSDGSYSAPVLSKSNDYLWPVRLTIGEEEVTIGDAHRIPLTKEGDVAVSMVFAGSFRRLFFGDIGVREYDLEVEVKPELGEEIWLEWEMRRLETQIAKASVADLYRMYNAGRKTDLLMALFLDTLLLNRKLEYDCDDDYPMSDLVSYMWEHGSIILTKDEEMKKGMIARVLMLTMMLPQLRQKSESLATMFPYFWIQREKDWLKEAFGLDGNAQPFTAEFRRLVPVLRREVRSVQGNLQRTLGEMETLARSLDSVLARQETHDQWQSKVRKFVPIALQGAFAGGLIVFSGGANPAAWNMMGNFFASGVLGNVCGIMLQDKEAMTHIQRVANTLFPWWEVFSQALVVSIHEAAQFIDAQNIVAMERDKALLGQVPEADRPAALERLKNALRNRIRGNKRSMLTEKLAGDTVRVKYIAQDIDEAIGKEMDRHVSFYLKEMHLGLLS